MSDNARRYLAGPLPLDSLAPGASFVTLLEAEGMAPRWMTSPGNEIEIPEATTVLAVKYRDGVVMAGDRRATAGNVIAHRRVQKVFAADEYSAVAISGTAGMAVELIKLFQTELEHYEKIEGTRLSLEGKANYQFTTPTWTSQPPCGLRSRRWLPPPKRTRLPAAPTSRGRSIRMSSRSRPPVLPRSARPALLR